MGDTRQEVTVISCLLHKGMSHSPLTSGFLERCRKRTSISDRESWLLCQTSTGDLADVQLVLEKKKWLLDGS